MVHRTVYAVSLHRLGTAKPRPGRLGTLFLETAGRTTGIIRHNALGYVEDGPNLVVVATNAGAPTDPAWWRNLEARPDAWVEIGPRRVAVHARAATGVERERLWDRFVAANPRYGEYERATSRAIPVVVLEPRPG
jgi:deazaflavin-dependent oxidoreductase (nitroreductase family)